MSISRSAQGFTLIELLVVIAIIGILAAGAIPNLLRARMSAQEAATIGACRTVTAAQTDYHNNSSPHSYADSLGVLGTGFMAGNVRFIDENLASGTRMGYIYRLQAGTPVYYPGESFPVYNQWSMTAWPVVYGSSGSRSFYVDESGVVRGSDLGGTTATVLVPSIQ
jgi:type IV pilus assembly protein PilA